MELKVCNLLDKSMAIIVVKEPYDLETVIFCSYSNALVRWLQYQFRQSRDFLK